MWILRHLDKFVKEANDAEIKEAVEGLNSEMRGMRERLAEIERAYLAVYREAQDRDLFHKRGTKEKPLVVDDWNKMGTLQQYAAYHVHDKSGKCWKNRFGYPCENLG